MELGHIFVPDTYFQVPIRKAFWYFSAWHYTKEKLPVQSTSFQHRYGSLGIGVELKILVDHFGIVSLSIWIDLYELSADSNDVCLFFACTFMHLRHSAFWGKYINVWRVSFSNLAVGHKSADSFHGVTRVENCIIYMFQFIQIKFQWDFFNLSWIYSLLGSSQRTYSSNEGTVQPEDPSISTWREPQPAWFHCIGFTRKQSSGDWKRLGGLFVWLFLVCFPDRTGYHGLYAGLVKVLISMA